jgi:hypothetical protein
VHFAASAASAGRKTVPTAYSRQGEVEPFAGADLAEKDVRDADHDAGAVAGGLVASQRTRCSRLTSTWIPCRTTRCSGTPSIRATKPTPQLSWSFAGSYSPDGFGTPAAFMRNVLSFILNETFPKVMSCPSPDRINYGTAPVACAAFRAESASAGRIM